MEASRAANRRTKKDNIADGCTRRTWEYVWNHERYAREVSLRPRRTSPYLACYLAKRRVL